MAADSLVESEAVFEGGCLERVGARVVLNADDAGMSDDGVQHLAAAWSNLHIANGGSRPARKGTWACQMAIDAVQGETTSVYDVG